MNVSEFVEKINQGLKAGLPGEKTHRIMLPNQRSLTPTKDGDAKKSAVLILVDFNSQDPNLTFIERARYDGVHSGQIAFPGGKFEKSKDRTLIDTAIRETFEEVGYKAVEGQIVCELSKLYIEVSNTVIYPYVAIVPQLPVLKPNSIEVEDVFSVPLKKFTSKNINKGLFKGHDYMVEAPYWNVKGKRIWGATAMMVAELVGLLNENNTI